MKICRVGRVPGSNVVHQMYKWVDNMGRPASPPPELTIPSHDTSESRKSTFSLLKCGDERKVTVYLICLVYICLVLFFVFLFF